MKAFKLLIFVFIVNVFSQCTMQNTESPGNLTPPTADQDADLPQLEITVGNHTRALHLEAFGDPSNPPVLIMPGGPGADYKLLLPLAQLANSYYVVIWDPRGAGLSERVDKEELYRESFNEEIDQVKSNFAAKQKVILIGHSWGGIMMAHYTAAHPDKVKQLILIEPGKLDMALRTTSKGGDINFLDGQDFFWQNEILTSSDHAVADYKAVEVLRKSSRNWTCHHSIIHNYPMWRFGAFQYYTIQNQVRHLPKNFNWATAIENYQGRITIISGTCGALSKSFQEKTNLLTLPDADFKTIEGANHISLFTDYANETVSVVREALEKSK